jgi:hypothetical protein
MSAGKEAQDCTSSEKHAVHHSCKMAHGLLPLLAHGRGYYQPLNPRMAFKYSPFNIPRRLRDQYFLSCSQEDGSLSDLLQDEFVLTRMLRPINGEEPK